MSDTQKTPKPKPLPRPKEEKFAQLMASGEFAAWQAYYEVFPHVQESTARSEGPGLLRKPHIAARVAELQGMTADATVMTLKEWQEWHTRVMRTPIADIDETSDLAQEVVYLQVGGPKGKLKRGESPEGNEQEDKPIQTVVKVKSVCKQASSQQLAKHFGWTKEEVRHSGTVGVEGLGELLGSITRPGLPHRAEEKLAEAPDATGKQ